MLASIRGIFASFQTLYAAMRAACSRLLLVGDAEIAVALAHADTPDRIPAGFLATCFPGITALEVATAGDQPHVHALVCAVRGHSGDRLELAEPVATGIVPLHEWMMHLDIALRRALRERARACLDTALALDDALLEAEFPLQAVALVDSLVFVDAAERALGDVASGARPDAVRQLAAATAVRLETLSQRVVRANGASGSSGADGSTNNVALTATQLAAFRALVLTGQAHRDASELLVCEGAASASSWAWLRQIRHYWLQNADECHICVGDATIAYGWEYLGGDASSEELLLLHSDRSLLAACAAMSRSSSLSFCPAAGSVGVPSEHFARVVAATFGRLLVHVECHASMSHFDLASGLQVSSQHICICQRAV